MGPDFHPMPGAEGWQLSNPPILALAALRASIGHFLRGGARTFACQERITDRISAISARPNNLRPSFPSSRHGKRSKEEPNSPFVWPALAASCATGLAAAGTIGDWREPDIFRVAPVPLYNTYQDVYRFVQHFSAALS